MSIRIYTDSGADLELQEVQDRKIGIVPLTLQMGDRSYRATADFPKEKFFQLLSTVEEFPTTSQPAPADFEDIFEEARLAGDDVVVITISSALSGTCQCARTAKAMGGYDNVYIVDSLSATLGQKLLVMEACNLRDRSFGPAEIADRVERIKNRIRIYAAVDTLEYLYKGGRLSKAAAGIGTMAQLKPILTVTKEGSVHVAGKAIGKAKAAKQVVTFTEKAPIDHRYPVYGVYSGDKTNYLDLCAKLEKIGVTLTEKDGFSLGPVIGAHVGPGAYGIVYIEASK